MKNPPTVSILVPVYNPGEDRLKRCLKSIINQSFTNFELILVNDGSTDKSGEICDAFAAKDKRIRVFHQKNGGASVARNACLAAARGKYIGWVDSDDFIKENMFETLYQLAHQHDADIVECRMLVKSGNVFIKTTKDGPLVFGEGDFVLHEFFSYRMKPSLFTKLYKFSCWEGVRFPGGRNHQDCYVNILFALKHLRYTRTNDAYYFHDPKEQSITTTLSKRAIREALHLFDFEIDLAHNAALSSQGRQYLRFDAVNRMLQRCFYIFSKTSITNQKVYATLIRKKLGFNLYKFLASKKLVLKTRISYFLMVWNMMPLQKGIQKIVGIKPNPVSP